MFQEHRGIERQDHLDKSECSDQGSIEYPFSIDKVAQISITNMQPLFRKQDPILTDVELEDILHGSQSPSKLYSPRNIQRFQGRTSSLPTPPLPYHHSACRRQVWAFEEPG